jgi:hypothetical protein
MPQAGIEPTNPIKQAVTVIVKCKYVLLICYQFRGELSSSGATAFLLNKTELQTL